MELGNELISRRGELISRASANDFFGCFSRFGGVISRFFAFGGCFRVLGGIVALCGYLCRFILVLFFYLFVIELSKTGDCRPAVRHAMRKTCVMQCVRSATGVRKGREGGAQGCAKPVLTNEGFARRAPGVHWGLTRVADWRSRLVRACARSLGLARQSFGNV